MPLSQSSLDKALFDILEDAVVAVSPNRTILRFNRAAEALFGVVSSDAIGAPLHTLFQFESGVENLFGMGKSAETAYELTFVRIEPKSAPAFKAKISVAPVTDNGGRLLSILFVIKNVSPVLEQVSRYDTQAKDLSALVEFYEAMFEKSPVMFLRLDEKGVIKNASDLYCRFVGLPKSEVISKSVIPFMDETQKKLFVRRLTSLTEPGPLQTYEQTITHDGNTFLQVWSVQNIFKNGVIDGVLCLGYDVTKFQEKTNSIAAQSLELQRKNEALGQFAAVVSHDLKAPLRHIAMFADMMNEDIANQKYDELGLYAHHVRNSAVRMDRIIKSLLQYSQIAYRIATRVNFDPASVVVNAIQNLETFVEEAKAEILVGKLPVMNGDPELMRHLIQNLISNAVKYRRPGIRPQVKIYAIEKDNEIQLVVEDNGIGIDPQNANRIFGPFQRLHKDEKKYEGFGIGLALCKQIAESHDGSIELDTEYSGGARFVVRLPVPKSQELSDHG